MTDQRVQFFAVAKELLREFDWYVTPNMFSSDVSEPYETQTAILEHEHMTDRQRLDQLFNNIDLQHGSATDMTPRMLVVISHWVFDEGIFRQLFLFKLPRQMQTVLISFRNNAVDELAASVYRILEITRLWHVT